MASPCGFAATIDFIGEDLLQNTISRLSASSFASAACVSRFWNLVCHRIQSRPKLSSAVSLNSSLQVAVEEVPNKVLSEPIRPLLPLPLSVRRLICTTLTDSYVFSSLLMSPKLLHRKELHIPIIAKLGSKVPVITKVPSGIIGRDVVSDEFKEIEWEIITGEDDDDLEFLLLLSVSANQAIMLIVGFVPGLKIKTIPLLKQVEDTYNSLDPHLPMIEKFVMDIGEYSVSISGHRSPAAIIMLNDWESNMKPVMQEMDYAMLPDTVIVGDSGCRFVHRNNFFENTTVTEEHVSAAVALVFARDKDKLPGPTCKAASVREKQIDSMTWLTARREGFRGKIDGETLFSQVYDECSVHGDI